MTMADTSPDKATRAIELAVEIDAPAEAVWKAISEGEEVRRWFSPEARIDPGVGGSVWLSWGPGMDGEAPITIWEPGKRLRWVESHGSSEEGDETGAAVEVAVEFHVETRGGGAVVRLVNSGFSAAADWDDYYDALLAGWTYFLWNLRFYMERHHGQPRTMVSVRRKTTRSFEDIWVDLLGPSGMDIEGVETLTTGEPLVLTIGDRRFTGEVEYVRRPRNLAGTLTELNDGLLFIEMETSGSDSWACGVWISAYGVPDEETGLLQSRLTALADRLFPDLERLGE